MVQLPLTIYDRVAVNALSKGDHTVTVKIMLDEFMECKYGKEKALKWIKEMAEFRHNTITNGVIKLI